MRYAVFYNLTSVVNAYPLWQSVSGPGVDAEYSCYHPSTRLNMLRHVLRQLRTKMKPCFSYNKCINHVPKALELMHATIRAARRTAISLGQVSYVWNKPR